MRRYVAVCLTSIDCAAAAARRPKRTRLSPMKCRRFMAAKFANFRGANQNLNGRAYRVFVGGGGRSGARSGEGGRETSGVLSAPHLGRVRFRRALAGLRLVRPGGDE